MQDEHLKWMKFAYTLASNSKDESTQNGAVIVGRNVFFDKDVVVGSGWNDIPGLLHDTPERRQRPLKYQWTEHAERAAIYDAARTGFATHDATMYCPWLACADCGRAIVMAGIKRVVRHKIPEHETQFNWLFSITVADEMFKEAGIEIVELVGKIGATIRFGGVMIDV